MSYSKAGSDVTGMAVLIMDKHHKRLIKANVVVDVLFKSDGLALHGYPVIATVKVNSLKQRALGQGDALIVIDWYRWEYLTEAEKQSVIDHELEHLEPQYDKKQKLKTDNLGRPKLKLKPHDWQLGGFNSIVERHGKAAIEYQAFQETVRQYRQSLFVWSDDQAGDTEEQQEAKAKLAVVAPDGPRKGKRKVKSEVMYEAGA